MVVGRRGNVQAITSHAPGRQTKKASSAAGRRSGDDPNVLRDIHILVLVIALGVDTDVLHRASLF